MGIILVEHDRPEPALYSAVAAVVAQARGAEAMHLPAHFEGAEALQHVTADGALVPSGLIWFERCGIPISAATTPTGILSRARENVVVVPIADGVIQPTHRITLEAAAATGIAVEHVRVEDMEERSGLSLRTTSAVGDRLLTRDGFGRFITIGEEWRVAGARHVRVAIVGCEADHREVNPATLAALGDAADTAGLAVDLVFVAPGYVDEELASDVAFSVDGVVLPGGANMASVPAQIMIAEATLSSGTPTIGLCLGMQTMTTAVVRRRFGRTDANLTEVDPHAAVKTFVPLVDAVPERHRLGAQSLATVPGSRLHALLGPSSTIRSNHRYKLNLELAGDLQTAGLMVTATDTAGVIAEGVELSGHPFFVGMQGHPELMSRRGAPHPLLKSFLNAAASRLA